MAHPGLRLSLLKQPALEAGDRHLFDYPTPSLLNFLWGFGSLGGIGLQVQIVTGIVLAMHYTPHVVCAGVSIEHRRWDVWGTPPVLAVGYERCDRGGRGVEVACNRWCAHLSLTPFSHLQVCTLLGLHSHRHPCLRRRHRWR